MDIQKTRHHSYQLKNWFVYGKNNVSSDYSILNHCGHSNVSKTEIHSQISLASDWIQACLSSHLNFIIAYVVRPEGYFVIRACYDSEPDHLGRPKGTAFLGELENPLDPKHLIPCLKLIHSFKNYHSIPEELTVNFSTNESSNVEPELFVVLRKAKGHVCLSDINKATSLVETVGIHNLDWFAVPSGSITNPPKGIGVILTKEDWRPPRDIIKQCQWNRKILNGFSFHKLFTAPQEEHSIALSVLLGEDTSMKTAWGLSWESRSALAEVEQLRSIAFDSLPEDQISKWISSPLLELGDLSHFIGKVSDTDRIPIINFLGRQDCCKLTLYYKLFPGDVEGMLKLLPKTLADTWSTLEDIYSSTSKTNAEELWQQLENTPWLDEMEVCQYAKCARYEILDATSRLHSWLLDSGLSGDEVKYLLGAIDDFHPKEHAPSLIIEPSWVQGLNAHAVLRILSNSYSNSWKEWSEKIIHIMCDLEIINKTDLYPHAIKARSQSLLRKCLAPQSLLDFACSNKIILLPPDEEWPQSSSNLIIEMISSEKFFERVHPQSVEDLLKWLESFEHESLTQLVEDVRARLNNQAPLPIPWIHLLGPVLERIPLLKQITAWYKKKDRNQLEKIEVLKILICNRSLSSQQSRWFNALLSYTELPASPWNATELLILLPILDIDRDVIRVILSRKKCEESEEQLLLETIKEMLPSSGIRNMYFWPDGISNIRHNWVRELQLFANKEDHECH